MTDTQDVRGLEEFREAIAQSNYEFEEAQEGPLDADPVEEEHGGLSNRGRSGLKTSKLDLGKLFRPKLEPYVDPSTEKVNEILVENGLEPTRKNRRKFIRQAQKTYDRALKAIERG